MQGVWSNIRESPRVLVTADAVGLYSSIPHKEGILALKNKLEEQTSSKIATNDLVKLAKFVLKNNCLECNNKIKQQISGIAIGTKLTPPYLCMHQSFVWLIYIGDIFSI